MAGQGKSGGKWRPNERGAVAVEFALVLPLLGMLMFGIVSFGLAFSDNVALANAVREGARFAASTDATAGTWGASVVQRTQDVYANADSPLDSSQVCAVVMDSTGTAVQSSSAECANGTSPVGPLPSSDPPDDTQPGSCYVMVW